MDPNLFHTIIGGIEVKVSDIIVIFLNIGVFALSITVYLIFWAYQTYQKKKATRNIPIGFLTHLADISGDKLYQWKQSNRSFQNKKKGFLKTSRGKQPVSSEEIICKNCSLIIKTNTVNFN